MTIDVKQTEEVAADARNFKEWENLKETNREQQTTIANLTMRLDELARHHAEACRKCDRMFDMIESLIRITDR